MQASLTALIAGVVLLAAVPASGQLLEAGQAHIVYGHHHLNVTDVNAHRRFFADTLGGVSLTVAGRQIIRFTNVLVFLRAQAPTGGTTGSAVDHIAFGVSNLRATVDRVKANGYRVVTAQERTAGWRLEGDLATRAGQTVAVVMGPDAVKVELVEEKAQRAPIALHHVHFASPEPARMQTWYGTVFRAKAPQGAAAALALPSVRLEFLGTGREALPTKGRVLDHVGFEIDNLDTFLSRIEDMGVRLQDVGKVPELGLTVAFITDPWGTSIELTEGLDRIR